MLSSITKYAVLALALASTASAAPVSPVVEESLDKRNYQNARMTYYDVSVGLGACGNQNSNSDFTVALNQGQFGYSYPSQYCGQTITISYGGKTAQASIQDSCPGCPYGGLDLSPGLFSYFADQSVGVIYATWDFGGSANNAPAPPTTSTTPAYTPPAPTSTTPAYTPPTTSETPTSTYTPPTSTYQAPTSTYVPPTTTAAAAPTPSTSSPAAAASTSTSQTTGTPSSSSAAASASASPAAASPSVQAPSGNLEVLSGIVVNFGSLIVKAASL